MKYILSALLVLFVSAGFAQSGGGLPDIDSGTVIVHKDPRLDQLIKKQIEINEVTTREARKNIKGYRLLVINTNNRDEVMAAKTQVYNNFPELTPYLIWQSPFFKLKVGNFRTREEADDYRRKMNAYFPKGVFIINDIIEVKLDTPESGN